MRHLVAALGAILLIVFTRYDVTASDSSTAALEWLTVPFLLAWWFGCVYLAASVWRRRSGSSAVVLALLVVLPVAAVAAAAMQGDHRQAPLVQPVDPGPGGVPIANRNGLQEYLCPTFEFGGRRFDRTIVYGVTCADARLLMERALASSPKDRPPVSFTNDGYAWQWSINDYGDVSLEGRQPAVSLTGRHILVDLKPLAE